MAERTEYSCDWCCVDSPSSGHVGDDWKIVVSPTGQKLHMCAECFKAGADAWEKARAKRFRDTHPIPGDGDK